MPDPTSDGRSMDTSEAVKRPTGGRHGMDEQPGALARTAMERAESRPRRPAQKKSVTLDAVVAEAVAEHVERGAASSFSAALNEAAARWAANQSLGVALDELYAEHPDARPSEDAVAEAAAKLGIT